MPLRCVTLASSGTSRRRQTTPASWDPKAAASFTHNPCKSRVRDYWLLPRCNPDCTVIIYLVGSLSQLIISPRNRREIPARQICRQGESQRRCCPRFPMLWLRSALPTADVETAKQRNARLSTRCHLGARFLTISRFFCFSFVFLIHQGPCCAWTRLARRQDRADQPTLEISSSWRQAPVPSVKFFGVMSFYCTAEHAPASMEEKQNVKQVAGLPSAWHETKTGESAEEK